MENFYLVEIEAVIKGTVLAESEKDAEEELRRLWQSRGVELLDTIRVSFVEPFVEDGEAVCVVII